MNCLVFEDQSREISSDKKLVWTVLYYKINLF
jgi:hypothetical protein